jgi:hypothetical protein
VVVAYGVCVGSWDKFQQYVTPNIERLGGRSLFAVAGQSSIAVAYNSILNACRDHGFNALVLQHDDLEIIDVDAEEIFLTALTDSTVGLVGVCGGKGETSLAWWNTETIGHQLTDSGMLDFGPREGDVAFIEGSIMVLSPWFIHTITFDEMYQGFHSYDEICASVRKHGKRVVVVDVNTHHHTTLGFRSDASAQQWAEGNARFQRKWGFA